MDTKQFSLNNQTGATNPGQQNEVISSSIISQFFVRTMAKDIADIAQKQKAGQSRVSLFVKPIIAQPEPPPPEKPLPKTTAQPQTIPATPSPPTDLPIAKPLPLVTIRPSTPPAPPLPPKQIQPAPGAPPKPIPPVPPLLAQEVKKILDAVPIPIQKTPTPIQKLEERPFLSSIKSVLEKISNKKVLLFASIGILAVLILGLGGWLLSRRGPGPSPSQTPTPSLTQSPSQTPIVSATPTPLAIPSPPFTMEKQEVISLNLDQKFPISTVLQSLAQSQNSGAFTQVAFKTAAQEGEEARLLTLSEFASFFSLTSFSPNIADSTTSPATTTKSAIYLSDLLEQNQYFPFVYYQTQDGSSPFSGGLYPARFGLIAALKNNDKEADIKKILKNLEPTMPEELKDLLIFANGAIEIPESPKFIDNTYKNFDIRYMNFPFSTLTLDYAIVNNYLILTTSKEAMYVVIDRLLTDTTVVKIEQPKDIADWLVYRSEKYEYEIKYPKNWFVEPTYDWEIISNYASSSQYNLDNMPSDLKQIFIGQREIKESDSLETLKPQSDEIIQLIEWKKFYSQYGVEGRILVQNSSDHPTGPHSAVWFLDNKKHLISFGPGTGSEDIKDMFLQIASTFKLVN